MTAAAPRPPRPPLLLGAGAVVLVVVAIVVAAIGLQPRPTAPRAADPPPTAALIVSVAQTGERTVSLGFPTTLTVRALSDQPIASVELWLGARLLAQASNTGGGPAQVARWSWTPATAGPATIIARATDVRGREAQSAPLRISVDPDPPTYRTIRPVTIEAGDTANDAALRVGGETADLVRWNEGLDPMAALETGTIVFVPLAVRAAPMPEDTDEIRDLTGGLIGRDDTAVHGAGTVTLASWSGAGPDVTVGPAANGTGLFVPPEVTPSVEDCTIELAVASDASNATGLAVYGLTPDASNFAQVAAFPAGGDAASTYETPAAAGAYLFSVSTYDGAVEEQGDLVEVVVPPECGEPGWSGAAQLSAGLLLVDAPVGRAYLYLSQDGGPWRRLPSDPDAFVESVDDQLDFGAYLPDDLASTTVDLEAWGWSGAGLLPLGTGHQEPAPTPDPSAPAPVGGGGAANLFAGGTFTELDWIAKHASAGSPEIPVNELLLRDGELVVWTTQGAVRNSLTEDFRWLTNATGVDSLVWQVAAFPMSKDLAPETPGVLLQKVVPQKEGTQDGVFPIDFRPIFAPPAQTAEVGDVMTGGLIQQLSLAEFGSLQSGSPAPATPSPLGAPATVTDTGVYSPTWLLPKFIPSVLYVRAIPMDGAKVVGGVSNFVKLAVVADGTPKLDANATFAPGPQPTPGPTPGLKPYQLFLQFLPPANANPEFSDCVTVTGFESWVNPAQVGLKVGDFFCAVYSNTDGGWSLAGAFEDFVDFVADTWDAVTEAWSWLQDKLVSAMAKYSGCSSFAGKGFCEGLAKVGLSVALASAGIPPSLPNTKELIAMGKGELKDALVDLAGKAAQSTLGYDPCAAAQGIGMDTCQQIADQLVNELVAQLDALKTQEASAFTGVQIPPGIHAVPHPWGQLRPPRFRLTIARNVAIPLPTTGECRMRLSMTSHIKDWTHKYYTESTKKWGTITENVAGSPFLDLTIPVPDPSKAEGAIVLSPELSPDASVYEILLAALNKKVLIIRDYYLTDTAFWRESNNPGQIYVAGQGYISFVDHGNRAWVLLQPGAATIANVSRPPYAADCFDPVAAFSVIALKTQGYPCVPTYGWMAETVKDPFVGTFTQKIECSKLYKQALGY